MSSFPYEDVSSDDNMSPKEAAFIDKEIDKIMKEAKKAARTFDKIRSKFKPAKIKASMGYIPDVIYSKNPTPQSNFLASLPPEIQRMVWSYLVLPADRISFGLTCKSHAQVFEELRPIYQKIAIKHYLREHRLAVLIRLIEWMPIKYRLCFTCVRFIKNTRVTDWGGDPQLQEESWSVREGRVSKDAMIRGPRCLDCRRRDGIEKSACKKAVQDVRALLKRNLGSRESDFE